MVRTSIFRLQTFAPDLTLFQTANRAKSIKNKPEANAKMTKREMIKEYSVELRELRQQLEAMRYKIGVYLPTETYNKLQEELTEFKEKEIIFTEKIEMKEKELSEVQELFERQTRELTQTTKKYEETKVSHWNTKIPFCGSNALFISLDDFGQDLWRAQSDTRWVGRD